MEGQDWDIERAKFDKLAASHFEEQRYLTALKWYRLSAALVEESMVEARGAVHSELPAAFDNMARVYHFICEYEYAVLYYSHSVIHNRYLGRFERTFDQRIAMANCWCTLGEVKATAAALERAFSQSHFIVATDEPGYSELMEALDVLKSTLSDHVDHSSDQQKANAYALMRQVYRLTGKVEDAQEMHNLCAKHGRGEYDTTGHGLLTAQQSTEDACLYLRDLLEQPNVDHFRKRDAHNALGLVRVQQGRFKEARQHHLDALKLCFQQRCTNVAMLTYYYLGQVEHRASTGTESEEHYWKKGRLLDKKLKARSVSLRKCSAEALLTNGRLERMSELYNYRLALAHEDLFAIAYANVKLNNFYLWTTYNSRFILEKAHEALDLIGRLPEADSRVTDMLAKCHSQIGEAYCRMGKLEKANDSFRIALDLHHKVGNKIAQIAILVQIQARLKKADYRKDLERALRVLEEVGGQIPSTLHKSLKTEVQTLLLFFSAQEFREFDSVGAELGPVSIEDLMTQFARCKQAAEESFDANSYIQAQGLMAGVHSWASLFFYKFAQDAEEYGLQDDFYEDIGLTRTSSLAEARKVNFRKLQKMLHRSTLENERRPVGLDLRSKLEGSVPWNDFAFEEKLAEEKMHEAHLEFARRRGGPLALASSLTTIAMFYKNNGRSYKTRCCLEEAALLQSNFLFGVEAIFGASLECMHITRVTHTALLECIAEEKDPAVHEEGLVWAERLRARTLLHSVESNMKKDPFMEIPQFDTDKRAAVKRLKDFSAFYPSVVFVEYSLLENELLIWVVKNGSIVLRQKKHALSGAVIDAVTVQDEETLFMPAEDFERITENQRSAGRLYGFRRNGVRAFINGAVEAIRNSVRADEYLELLGRFLLLPIFEDLADVRQDQYIVFIPDQELLYVPFPALRLKEFKNGNYLINQYPVFVSMSLRAYEHFERRYAEMKDKTAHRPGVSTVLVVSNPYPLDSPETMGLLPPHNILKPLANAEKEAQSIVQCIEKNAKTLHVHHLQRHQAQKVAVMNILPKADWVHFACHGFVSESYPLGAIALGQSVRPTWLRWLLALIAHICMWLWAWLPSFVYQRRAGAANSDGILGADDVNFQSGMQARCVVLNACNSAQGKITEEGILNWSHTLQIAGVSSIVLCLWEVHDLAGSLFMSKLYQHLTSKESLGLAFQKAMVAMINDQDRKWEPKHWALYIMVGVPHVRLPVDYAEC